ncbi:hypothetical protein [Nocardioides rubriscoriae]|uniref:hypothetical protein n=1 Tax=Nocardioides rubriscoriae TaxID=642762 RepID=UPI0011DF36E0|nr:hypothetical protein [Nocardioides rubriscoriae]
MTWLGLVLLGVGTTDLVYSWWGRPRLAEGLSAVVAVVVALLAGVGGLGLPGLLGVVAVVVAVVVWGESVTYGFGARRYALPLVVLGGVVVAGVLASVAASPDDSWLGDWLDSSTLPALADLDAGRALLVAGTLLVQLSTGNVVVRLVLGVTGTTNPMRSTTGPAPALKGGRLLGPMERLFIVGLGLAGQVTAASIVIAAKGLLRFPELQSARASPSSAGPGIHEVTEYFLVGSFVSWSVSLVSLVLVAT